MEGLDSYWSGSSPLHHLDPRLKTAGWIVLSLLLTFSDWQGLLVSSVGLIMSLLVGKIPLRLYRSVVVALLWLGIFYVVALGWNWPESWYFWQGDWSLEGLQAAGMLMWRIAILFGLMRLFIAVTPPLEQGLSLAYFLTPLNRLTPKAADLALLIMLTLRFIPLLFEEAKVLWKARVVKGNLPGSWGGWIKELWLLLPPLVYLSLRRAEETAENMLARGYTSGSYRTLTVLEWKRIDYWGMIVIGGWSILLALTNFLP